MVLEQHLAADDVDSGDQVTLNVAHGATNARDVREVKAIARAQSPKLPADPIN
jgi:hypothetical protein